MSQSRLNTLLATLLIITLIAWIVIPFVMALLWSLVDPGTPWSYPDIFPPALSFER
jgi:putative spermidine/putrescine transport system permease protein